jgi:MYXO-CTERM domain-containing protein
MRTPILAPIASAVLFTLLSARVAHADTVVQIPVDSILNGRSVSTLNGATVVPWTVGQGVDGDGQSDGFVTLAVEAKLGQTGMALPNDGVFPASTMTGAPEIDLHFANTNPTTTFQTHVVHGSTTQAQTFHFAVPPATYSMIYLIMTCSEGDQPLTVTMTYADATTSTDAFTLPDYGSGKPLPTTPPIFFDVIAGMHKWNTADAQVDTTGHTITGVRVTPTATKDLTDIAITKPAGGHYLVFWGATGMATSGVDSGVVESADASLPDAALSTGDASATSSSGGSSGGSSSGSSSSSSGGGNEGDAAGTVGPANDAGQSGDASPEASAGGSNGCNCSQVAAPPAPWQGVIVAVLVAIPLRRARRRSPHV